tara:strand:- start:241 stop:450 length:210 start_codon:yes stop_codon:yes gene_type:complete
MPTKFKPSATVRLRGEAKATTTHYYIKNISQEELFETLNNSNTVNKKKQKIRNELARRGVNIVMVPKDV